EHGNVFSRQYECKFAKALKRGRQATRCISLLRNETKLLDEEDNKCSQDEYWYSNTDDEHPYSNMIAALIVQVTTTFVVIDI
uniref:Uncharacterized protein n=1 Tax=Parascaris univalens TaxID=6257 RepID=A0A915BLP9_PARUN